METEKTDLQMKVAELTNLKQEADTALERMTQIETEKSVLQMKVAELINLKQEADTALERMTQIESERSVLQMKVTKLNKVLESNVIEKEADSDAMKIHEEKVR